MILSKFRRSLIVCLATAAAGVASGQVLFDQDNGCLENDHAALSSRLGRSTHVESAEDFVVPQGKIWRPNRVITQGSREILDEQVRINVYADTEEVNCSAGEPCPDSVPTGDPLCSVIGTAAKTVVVPLGRVFPFQVDLPQDFCELTAGRYWMSITNVDSDCGIGAACETWAWSENRESSDTREWVIRDVRGTTSDVSCNEFGLGNSCQKKPAQPQLCLAIEGESEDERAPLANPDMLVETLFVGQSLELDLSPFFDEPNGQPLTYSSNDLASFISLNSQGTITIKPDLSLIHI